MLISCHIQPHIRIIHSITIMSRQGKTASNGAVATERVNTEWYNRQQFISCFVKGGWDQVRDIMSFFKEKYFFLREICFDRGSLSLVVVFFYLQEMINLYLTVLTNLFQKKHTQKNNFILWQCFYFYFYLYFSQTSNLQSHNLPFFSPPIALTHLLKAFTQWHAM